MADSEERPSAPDRKQRKSVVFNEEAIVVEADGKVKTAMAVTEDSKDTAMSHSSSTPLLSAAFGAFTDLSQAPAEEAPAEPSTEATAEESLLALPLKKKKKKKAPKEEGADDLAARIAALDVENEGGEAKEAAAEETTEEQAGDMDKGTGIWQHDETKPIPYDLLLSRFFNLLAQKNPDHASSSSKSYKIPPPQCLREGNKKTIFANIPDICKRMNRTEEHVTAYLFAELGTSGSVDGSRRLVIKGRFQQKQIENVLRKYILEYVTCRTCRSPSTELNKGENRLYFITCNSCGSRRSVTAIRTGFSAQIGKRKKMQK
ncbi:domain found in IF2B/IF5-domain-containing protein [Xylariales sp. AK1849]|nr:domain found in IF2B/IF5-domain-containing protein [Xylariales sp. AK1849]